jgi:hypothetical protein
MVANRQETNIINLQKATLPTTTTTVKFSDDESDKF